jgi:hypothetical protein
MEIVTIYKEQSNREVINNYYTVHMYIEPNGTYKMLLYFNIYFLDDALTIR